MLEGTERRTYKLAVGTKFLSDCVVAAKAEEQIAVLDALNGAQRVDHLHLQRGSWAGADRRYGVPESG